MERTKHCSKYLWLEINESPSPPTKPPILLQRLCYASYLEQFRQVETLEDPLRALLTRRAPALDPTPKLRP